MLRRVPCECGGFKDRRAKQCGKCQMRETRFLNNDGEFQRFDCAVRGCTKISRSCGYCQMHYRRWYLYGDAGQPEHLKNEKGQGHTDSRGYRWLFLGGKRIQEHRVTMAQMIGRQLRSFESPHHKNGIRHDNRPENLELWTKPQPAGQRVEDLVAWVIENYRTEVEVALKEQEAEEKT